jgi:threonine/homoserine/homoserine lactone efflux protein
MRRDARKPVVITDAVRSVATERRSREVRYVIMMGIRAVCLVVLTVLASAHVGAAWLWAPLCLAGMVVLPWLAVQTANEPDTRKASKRPTAYLRDSAAEGAVAVAMRAEPVIVESHTVG